jgi:hypothetical protein
MFLLLFVYVFGGALGGSQRQYLTYVLPGIIVQNSLFTTMNTATGLATDLEKGFFDRLRSLPIARFSPLAGRIVADLVKQSWAIALLLAIGGGCAPSVPPRPASPARDHDHDHSRGSPGRRFGAHKAFRPATPPSARPTAPRRACPRGPFHHLPGPFTITRE